MGRSVSCRSVHRVSSGDGRRTGVPGGVTVLCLVSSRSIVPRAYNAGEPAWGVPSKSRALGVPKAPKGPSSSSRRFQPAESRAERMTPTPKGLTVVRPLQGRHRFFASFPWVSSRVAGLLTECPFGAIAGSSSRVAKIAVLCDAALFPTSYHPPARFSSPVRRAACAEPRAPPSKQHFLLRTARRDK